MRPIYLIIALIILTGCTKLGLTRTSPAWPWAPGDKVKLTGCLEGSCSNKDMYQAVMATLTYCREVSNHYENGGNVTDGARLGVKVFGVLAGSVFGITAGGSAAKAWSGLSGATNGIQSDLGENSLLRANRAKLISTILDDYDKQIKGPLSRSPITQEARTDVIRASLSVSSRCAVASEALPEDLDKKVDEQIARIKTLAAGANAPVAVPDTSVPPISEGGVGDTEPATSPAATTIP